MHSQNWYSRCSWGRRFYLKVAAESFPAWDTITVGLLFRIRFHFQLLTIDTSIHQYTCILCRKIVVIPGYPLGLDLVMANINRNCNTFLHPCKETTTFIINWNGIYFSSQDMQEQIAYFLTQEAVYLLVHFKFLSVWAIAGKSAVTEHRTQCTLLLYLASCIASSWRILKL